MFSCGDERCKHENSEADYDVCSKCYQNAHLVHVKGMSTGVETRDKAREAASQLRIRLQAKGVDSVRAENIVIVTDKAFRSRGFGFIKTCDVAEAGRVCAALNKWTPTKSRFMPDNVLGEEELTAELAK